MHEYGPWITSWVHKNQLDTQGRSDASLSNVQEQFMNCSHNHCSIQKISTEDLLADEVLWVDAESICVYIYVTITLLSEGISNIVQLWYMAIWLKIITGKNHK